MTETETVVDERVLAIAQNDIKVTAGEIHFDKLPVLKESVTRFVEKMKSVEVTDDNMQQSKKLIAATRKELDFLNEERKRIEKFYLEPLNAFKGDIKEISTTVSEAEDYVRNQVKELEHQAREQKEEAIKEVFEKHSRNYELFGVMDFTDFMRPQFSNKTFSMTKAEEEIVSWLQKTENDLQFLSGQEDGEKLVAEYKDTKDVTVAIQNVQRIRDYYIELERKLQAKQVEEAQNKEFRETKQWYSFEIEGSDTADRVEELLTAAGISFNRKVK